MPKTSSFTESFDGPHPGVPYRPGDASILLNDIPLHLDGPRRSSQATLPGSPALEATVSDERADTRSPDTLYSSSTRNPDPRADSRSIRSTRSRVFDDIKHEVMVNHIYQQQCSMLWIDHNSPANTEGVLLRRVKGHYLACPPQLIHSTFADACAQLNLQVAMTVNSRVIKSFVQSSPDSQEVPLKDGLRIQILPGMHHLPQARKYHFAAFLASEELLIVWEDNASNLIKRAKAIEAALTDLVWGDPEEEEEEGVQEKKQEQDLDPESGDPIAEQRPIHLINTTLVACTMVVLIVLLGLAARSLAAEIAVDRNYMRLIFLVLTPVQIFFTLVSPVQ